MIPAIKIDSSPSLKKDISRAKKVTANTTKIILKKFKIIFTEFEEK